MRHNLRVLAATELPEKDREAGRTEVLPVQWRKHLRLDVRLLLRDCSDTLLESLCMGLAASAQGATAQHVAA